VQVARRGFQIRVPQQPLNDDQIDAIVQQMRGKGMPQRMRMHRFGDRGQSRRLPAYPENRSGGKRTICLVSREEPVGGVFPPPVGDEHFAERVRQHDLPVFATLAIANPDHFSIAIEVLYFQVGHFRYPQSGSVHGGQNRPVARVLRRRQQRFDLFPAENEWKLLFVAWQWNPLDVDAAVQCVAIEKAEPANGLNVGRELDLLFAEQE